MSKPAKTIVEYRNYELDLHFPVLMLSGSRWHISDRKSGRLHFHNCFEIGLCHSDSGTMEFEDTPMHFKAGDMTFVSRNVPHTTYSDPGMNSLWSYLFVDPDVMLRKVFTEASPHADIFADMQQNCRMILNQEDHPELFAILNSILTELTEKKMNYRYVVEGNFLSLFMLAVRAYSAINTDSATQIPENALVIAPALDFIRENYMQDFPAEDLAVMCSLSPTHFRRVFHKIMGTSPVEYINSTRIMQSCSLLRTTEESILAISERVGFHSVSSYNRHFMEIMRTSPSNWRNAALKEEKMSILEYSGWR